MPVRLPPTDALTLRHGPFSGLEVILPPAIVDAWIAERPSETRARRGSGR